MCGFEEVLEVEEQVPSLSLCHVLCHNGAVVDDQLGVYFACPVDVGISLEHRGGAVIADQTGSSGACVPSIGCRSPCILL